LTRRLNIWLLSVLLIIGIPYYWHLVDAGAGPGAAEPRAKPVTMTQLRALAGALGEARPLALRVETVGRRMVSGNMLAAGSGLKLVSTAIRAYELVMPEGGPVVIDAGTSAPAARDRGFDPFDPAAQARIQRALDRAAHTVLLDDKPVHNGGTAAGTRRAGTDLPLPGGAPWTLAPGVVVIPLPGLGPGANMVYAQLANGREILFTGDAAKTAANWTVPRLPARFATRDEPTPYRSENLSWLMTIATLHRAAPKMAVVTGHDPANVPFSAGTFVD
jgi:hypothetical protein